MGKWEEGEYEQRGRGGTGDRYIGKVLRGI